ncbi:MAG: Flp pilus assembly protein CpaB [Eubacteriales bacterium]|nr:Flp pilus assembly protein CpaB [Eubacteriales bacterium]
MRKIVIFALIAALCAGALLYFYLGNLEAQKEVKVEYDNVVIAAVDIPAFTPITSDMVTFKPIPQGYAHPLAARTKEEVVGLVTESAIIAGEEMLPAKLKQFGETDSGLSYVVPEGMRAVTVSVDEVSGVAGFLQRGDYVDVISYTSTSYEMPATDQAQTGTTQPTDPGQNAVSQSTTLVAAQNVLVAAIGRSLSSSTGTTSEDQSTIGYNSVTLILTTEDAMRVVQGSRSGSLILILRASGDHNANTEDPVINDTLLIKAQ